MTQLDIDFDDPSKPEVAQLLQEHLDYANKWSVYEAVYAFGASRLSSEDIAFFSARRAGELVAVGALLHLDSEHAEIKSMHTIASARGQGIGKAMLEHLVTQARCQGYVRVSLETGTGDAFAPARSLYQSCGFEVCAPFGVYKVQEDSVCMTRHLS